MKTTHEWLPLRRLAHAVDQDFDVGSNNDWIRELAIEQVRK